MIKNPILKGSLEGLFTGITFFGIGILFLMFIGTKGYSIKMETVHADEKILKTSCQSDSMGLVIDCKNNITVVNYKNESLQEGSMYVYQNGNHTTLHRLVYCLDTNCDWSIFKGDNNEKGEMVSRDKILYKVRRIDYG